MSGLERAQRDPYWATGRARMQPRGRALVEEVKRLIDSDPVLRGVAWLGSGYRESSTEHKSGLALDIMFVPDVGRTPDTKSSAARNRLISWLTANARRLGIRHIIVSRDGKRRPQIYRTRTRAWADLKPRGSVTDDHVDHAHVLLDKAAQPTVKSVAAKNSTLVKRVQAGLLKVFPSYAGPIRTSGGVDGILGPGTRKVVVEFQKRSKLPATGVLDDATLRELSKYSI